MTNTFHQYPIFMTNSHCISPHYLFNKFCNCLYFFSLMYIQHTCMCTHMQYHFIWYFLRPQVLCIVFNTEKCLPNSPAFKVVLQQFFEWLLNNNCTLVFDIVLWLCSKDLIWYYYLFFKSYQFCLLNNFQVLEQVRWIGVICVRNP